MFPHKIRNIDLQKPTEQFLFSALECYLMQININMIKLRNVNTHQIVLRTNVKFSLQQAISSTDMQGELRFKIDFCRYIDHLYKISDATNNFMYYDLVQPGKSKGNCHNEIYEFFKRFFKFRL